MTFPYIVYVCVCVIYLDSVFVIAVNKIYCSVFLIWFEHLYIHSFRRQCTLTVYVCYDSIWRITTYGCVCMRLCWTHLFSPLFSFLHCTYWTAPQRCIYSLVHTCIVYCASFVVCASPPMLFTTICLCIRSVCCPVCMLYSKPFFYRSSLDLVGFIQREPTRKKQQTNEKRRNRNRHFSHSLSWLLARWHVLNQKHCTQFVNYKIVGMSIFMTRIVVCESFSLSIQ